ncbi:MAG: tetratricopeptide repeat protein [Solidesulfovibrio sp.]
MVSKIELYREVLEIEPNSKVFFPLARQLSEEGRTDEAAAILTRGIAFHPDHLEAKFLLIEILSRQGKEGEADAVFTDVGSMLARYPSVWLLWSKVAAARSKDPSLAMLFLAHYFQNESLTWAEVMERGLKSLGQGFGGDLPAAGEPCEISARMEPAAPFVSEREVPTSVTSTRSERDGGAPTLRGAREVMELAELLEAPEESGEKGKSRTAKAREAEVRTKTMAALLAEQGDTVGALGIYNELLAQAVSDPEREELRAHIAELSPTAKAAPASVPDREETAAVSEGGQTEGLGAQSKGATKLVNLLEALAGRLEARAGA